MYKRAINFMVLLVLFLFSSNTNAQQPSNLKINGMIQLWGLHSNETNTNSTFLLKRSELKLSGSIISDEVSFVFMLDPASVPRHLIQDLIIFYQVHPQARIAVGQMHYPLTMEGLQGSADLDFIDRAIIAGREYGDRRDIGVCVSGSGTVAEYALGMFGGAGTNITDTNNSKDFAGRVVFNVAKNIHVGASGYYGPKNQLATDLSTVKRNRAGFEFAYLGNHFSIKSEFMQGSEGSINNRGYYGTVTYTRNSKVQFGARFEGWDGNLDLSDNGEYMTTLGVNYKLKGNAAKIMVNYLIRAEQGPSISNNAFLTQFQVEF